MNQRVARAMRAANRHYADGGDVQDNRNMFSRAADTAMDYAGRGLALGDLYTGGVLSSLAGLNPFGSYSDVMAAREKALAGVPREAKALATEPINPVAAIFAGPMARTANKVMLRRAEELASQNAPREQIWQETGWFQGPDQKWRFEIDDSKSQIAKRVTDDFEQRQFGDQVPVQNADRFLDHPELFEAYPDLWRVNTRLHKEDGLPHGNYMQRESGTENVNIYAKTPGQARSVASHEYQHAIQDREKFAPGADAYENGALTGKAIASVLDGMTDYGKWPNVQQNIVRAARQTLPGFSGSTFSDLRQYVLSRQLLGELPNDLTQIGERMSAAMTRDNYVRSAGEQEASAVQKRLFLTPEQRRARAPWQDYSVPEADQIVRLR